MWRFCPWRVKSETVHTQKAACGVLLGSCSDVHNDGQMERFIKFSDIPMYSFPSHKVCLSTWTDIMTSGLQSLTVEGWDLFTGSGGTGDWGYGRMEKRRWEKLAALCSLVFCFVFFLQSLQMETILITKAAVHCTLSRLKSLVTPGARTDAAGCPVVGTPAPDVLLSCCQDVRGFVCSLVENGSIGGQLCAGHPHLGALSF